MVRASISAIALCLVTGVASAAPSIEYIDYGYAVTDLSYDGSAAAGNYINDGSYGAFRWTHLGGPARLGQDSIPAIGVGGGSPDISYDGYRVSASILSQDSLETIGLWDIYSESWTDAMPPMPADGRTLDQSYGSAWGLSGNGNFVTGFYWSINGGTQPCKWSQNSGMVSLPRVPRPPGQNKSCRVNAANYDGSVVGGWQDSGFGPWNPAVWRGSVETILNAEGDGQVNAINSDGSVLVGYSYDPNQVTRVATIWRWNGVTYDMQRMDALPDYIVGQGLMQFESVTADGSMAVGTEYYSMNPGGTVDPIVWTPAGGVVTGLDFLTSLGLSIPEELSLREISAVSADGSTIAFLGLWTDGSGLQSFLVHLTDHCSGDINHDTQVDDSDFVLFAHAYDMLTCEDPAMPTLCPSDLNRDGSVDDADFVLFASAYDTLICP